MRTIEEMMNDENLVFNIGDVLAHIDSENNVNRCEILSVDSQNNTALVRFENAVLARYVHINDLYNY